LRKAIHERIAFRLTAPIVAIIILVFTVLLPVMVYINKSIMEKNIREQLTHFSSTIINYINEDAIDLMNSLRLLVDIPEVNRALQEKKTKELTKIMLPVKLSLNLDFIAVIGQDKKPIVFFSNSETTVDELSGLDVVKKGLLGLNHSTVQLLNNKLYSIGLVSSNVWTSPTVIIAGRMLKKPLSMETEESLKDYDIVIYDLDGRVTLTSESNEWAVENLPLNMVNRITSMKKTFFQKMTHSYGLEHIIIYGPLMFDGVINAFFSIHIPSNDITAMQSKVIKTISLFMLAGIILMTVPGYLTSRWVSIRVRKLLQGTEKITNGMLGYQLDEHNNDELADLTRSFNHMSSSLMKSHEWWNQTFDSMTDAVSIHDVQGNIIKANEAAGKLMDMPVSELIGKKCFETFHRTDGQVDGCSLKHCSLSAKPEDFETFDETHGRWLNISTSPVFGKDGKLSSIIHVVRDITERKYTDTLVQHQYNRLSVLHSIEKAINSNLDLHATLNLLAEQVTNQLGLDAATVLLYKNKTQLLEYVVSKGFRSDALRHTKLRLGEGNAGKAALEKQVIHIPSLINDPVGFISSEHFADEGFVVYFAVPLISKGEIKGVLELFNRTTLNATYAWLDFLETIADHAATAIDNAVLFDELQRSRNELVLAYESIIFGWSLALDMRDRETEGHSKRVTVMTLQIAQKMGAKDEDFIHIRRGALLHDIGKMGIPDSILLKPGRLTEDERAAMERHTEYAYDLLSDIEYLKPAMDIPYCHHEKWDGTGYPRGLKGEEIPLAARIFSIIDVWDALSSDRPYRPAWPREKVMEYIRSESGKHFDPAVVDVFMGILEEEDLTTEKVCEEASADSSS
jgi:PAS domain S-box-containing protein/putative nucleotidyltransferase with HDIG domain